MLPLVAAAFDGIKCAVVALVAEALVKVGKRALKTNSRALDRDGGVRRARCSARRFRW